MAGWVETPYLIVKTRCLPVRDDSGRLRGYINSRLDMPPMEIAMVSEVNQFQRIHEPPGFEDGSLISHTVVAAMRWYQLADGVVQYCAVWNEEIPSVRDWREASDSDYYEVKLHARVRE